MPIILVIKKTKNVRFEPWASQMTIVYQFSSFSFSIKVSIRFFFLPLDFFTLKDQTRLLEEISLPFIFPYILVKATNIDNWTTFKKIQLTIYFCRQLLQCTKEKGSRKVEMVGYWKFEIQNDSF